MKLTALLKEESGVSSIVEATLVFPIVLFVLVILIFLGNVYYQMARVEAAVSQSATYAAGVYADPVLQNSVGSKLSSSKITVSSGDSRPYRYLLGNSSAETAASSYLKTQIGKIGSGFFTGMKPTCSKVSCTVKNYVIYQTITVTVNYSIQIPMFFFGKDVTLMKGQVSTSAAVSDPAEFVRNMVMVADFLEGSKLDEKLTSIRSNVSGWFGD